MDYEGIGIKGMYDLIISHMEEKYGDFKEEGEAFPYEKMSSSKFQVGDYEWNDDHWFPKDDEQKFNLAKVPDFYELEEIEKTLSPIQQIIKMDNLEKLQEAMSDPSYKPARQKIIPDIFQKEYFRWYQEKYLTDINTACFYGAVKCFKFILLNLAEKENSLSDSFKYAIVGQNSDILHILEHAGVDLPYDAFSAIKVVIKQGKEINADIFRWLIETKGMKITLSDAIKTGSRKCFEIGLDNNLKEDRHTIALAAKFKYWDYVEQHITEDNANSVAPIQHTMQGRHLYPVSGGETALFFAVEQRDFVHFKFLIENGADPFYVISTSGMTPIVYAFNDIKFGLKCLEIVKLDDYLFEHLITDSLINNAQEALEAVVATGYKPARRIRGAACLVRTPTQARFMMDHTDIFEIALADIDIINNKLKLKDIYNILQPDSYPNMKYFERKRFMGLPSNKSGRPTIAEICIQQRKEAIYDFVNAHEKEFTEADRRKILKWATVNLLKDFLGFLIKDKKWSVKTVGNFSILVAFAKKFQLEKYKESIHYKLLDKTLPDNFNLGMVSMNSASFFVRECGAKVLPENGIPPVIYALIHQTGSFPYLLEKTNDFTARFKKACDKADNSFVFEGLKVTYHVSHLVAMGFTESKQMFVISRLFNFLAPHVGDMNKYIPLVREELRRMKNPVVMIDRNGKMRPNYLSDDALMDLLMMDNESILYKIQDSRDGRLVFVDGRPIVNSPKFSYTADYVRLAFGMGMKMNPTKWASPLLIASMPPTFERNMRPFIYQYISHGADPRIEWDGLNVLGNLYRGICLTNDGDDMKQCLYIVRQKIYELNGRSKLRRRVFELHDILDDEDYSVEDMWEEEEEYVYGEPLF